MGISKENFKLLFEAYKNLDNTTNLLYEFLAVEKNKEITNTLDALLYRKNDLLDEITTYDPVGRLRCELGKDEEQKKTKEVTEEVKLPSSLAEVYEWNRALSQKISNQISDATEIKGEITTCELIKKYKELLYQKIQISKIIDTEPDDIRAIKEGIQLLIDYRLPIMSIQNSLISHAKTEDEAEF